MSVKNDLLASSPDELGITNNAQVDMPWWYDAWTKSPPPSRLMGFTAYRGQQTILRGGWSGKAFRDAPGLFQRGEPGISYSRAEQMGGMVNRTLKKFNPRSAFRYSHDDLIDPMQSHSVFQAAPLGNFMVRNLGKMPIGESTLAGKMGLSTALTKPGKGASLAERGAYKSQYLSGGFMSIQGAAGRLGFKGSASVSDSQVANVAKFIHKTDPEMANRIFARSGQGVESFLATHNSGTEMSQVLGTSGRGELTQQVGGFMRGVRGPMTDAGALAMSSFAEKGAVKASEYLAYGGYLAGEKLGVAGFGRAYAGTGVKMAIDKFATSSVEGAGRNIAAKGLEKAGMRVAEDAGLRVAEEGAASIGAGALAKFGAGAAAKLAGSAIPFVNVALWAWTAYDVGKMLWTIGDDVAKQQAQNVKDAVSSYQGGINKAPFSGWRGLGFIDTEAASTSRRRGVDAISNSRLNARSALGSEAGMLHAHFH